MKYCLVAVNSPFNNSLLSYQMNDEITVEVGDLLEVPLRSKMVKGCVLKINLDKEQLEESLDISKIKQIKGILTNELRINSRELEFYFWMSAYYHYPLGKLIFDSLPKILKRPRPLFPMVGAGTDSLPEMTTDQKKIFEIIRNKLFLGFSKYLIHGITGSGKTIIYLNLIKLILWEEKSVLFLLPEINLTPQFIQTFKDYLQVDIYTYNSSVSNSEKYQLWKRLKQREIPCVIIGVRSSIFLPIDNFGMIIVDEEHDQSFKQEDRCTYNARDLAIKKANLFDIPVILGSATPSVETYFNFKQFGDSNYLQMRKRVNKSKLPRIELVDLREKSNDPEDKDLWPFRKSSLEKIKKALSKDEQVLVFVNRLGFASYLQCRACGYQFYCPNCAINLKYFHKKNEVRCQYCDYRDRRPEICPECSNLNLLPVGFGTEKLQQVLKNFFPKNSIERFDRDDITTFSKLDKRLQDFHSGKIDILVGTQMLSKGHNFKNVNLVLIFGVDSQLNFPDFRSNERVYQQLTQISGRSGRFGKDSEVLIHTMGPHNKVYQHVKNHDFDDFYTEEIKLRNMSLSPPYSKMMAIYLSANRQDILIAEAERIGDYLDRISANHFDDVDILGPRPALIEKKVNKFTWVIMLRSININNLHNLYNSFRKNYKMNHRVSLKIDVDPTRIQ